jgi:hypothetical protein
MSRLLKVYSLIPDAVSAPMYSWGEAERLGWNLPDRCVEQFLRGSCRDSREKAKMNLTLQRNKPGNAGRLRRIRNTVLLGGLSILIPCTLVFAQAPDNSKTNQQYRSSVTADQQAENQGDRDLARKIRKAIIDDKDLSP